MLYAELQLLKAKHKELEEEAYSIRLAIESEEHRRRDHRWKAREKLSARKRRKSSYLEAELASLFKG